MAGCLVYSHLVPHVRFFEGFVVLLTRASPQSASHVCWVEESSRSYKERGWLELRACNPCMHFGGSLKLCLRCVLGGGGGGGGRTQACRKAVSLSCNVPACTGVASFIGWMLSWHSYYGGVRVD